ADQHQWRRADQRYRPQLEHGIVRGRIHRTSPDVARPIPDAQGVAVRRGLGSAHNTNACAGARDVLDHDRLPERDTHAFREDTSQRVSRSSRREWYDERHRTRWERLGMAGRAGPENGGKRDGDRYGFHFTSL